MEFAVGIDVGGTFTKMMLVQRPDRVIARGRIPTLVEAGAEDLVRRCLARAVELGAECGRRMGDAVAVGVGIAGLIDQRRGLLTTAPNLPGFDGLRVRDLFAGTFGLPTEVDNDANLWALGEAVLGAGRGYRTVAVLSLGTGVGGGLVDHGRLLHGALGMAAEFGHMSLTIEGGPACACGQRGCLESYVNAAAVVDRATRYAAERPDEVGARLSAACAAQALTAQVVGEAAGEGDRVALAVFEETGRYLGEGIANLVTALNPDAVVIGGGVAMVGEPLLETARRVALGRVLAPLAEIVTIVKARLGDQGGVLGAALLALDPVAHAGSTRPPSRMDARPSDLADDRPADVEGS